MAAGGLQLSDSEEATSSVITLPRFVEKALSSHDPLKDLFGGRIIPVFQSENRGSSHPMIVSLCINFHLYPSLCQK